MTRQFGDMFPKLAYRIGGHEQIHRDRALVDG
jgi:hypothetical protein